MANARRIQKRTYLLDSVVNGVTRVFDSVTTNFFTSVERETDVIMNKIEKRTYLLQKKIMNRMVVSFALGLAALFFLSSAYYYLTEIQFMSRASAFLILTVLLLLVAWALKRGGGNYGETEEEAY